MHEELRIVKEDVRKFRESEVGLDEGYEDIEKEDEPYYDNSDCDSFQSDEEEHVFDDELEGGSLRGEKEEILDYMDVLLQTNLGSTCVVKLKDSE
ncbi:hypothetical protein H5410_032208 [Solanum commersonii]|uniref:Uncharacterized protein n=1 Tax=Solanum commersonii TaxID=4109 RepID=A0A9J5YPP0_SOLCO|nr:hypothetical protein H5410_032208 [Solanum commersonii]